MTAKFIDDAEVMKGADILLGEMPRVRRWRDKAKALNPCLLAFANRTRGIVSDTARRRIDNYLSGRLEQSRWPEKELEHATHLLETAPPEQFTNNDLSWNAFFQPNLPVEFVQRADTLASYFSYCQCSWSPVNKPVLSDPATDGRGLKVATVIGQKHMILFRITSNNQFKGAVKAACSDMTLPLEQFRCTKEEAWKGAMPFALGLTDRFLKEVGPMIPDDHQAVFSDGLYTRVARNFLTRCLRNYLAACEQYSNAS